MSINPECILDSFRAAIEYLPNTLKMTLIPLIPGILLGTVIALVRVYHVPLLGRLFAAVVTVYQGIPLMVMLLVYNLLYMNYFGDVLAFFHINVQIADIDTIYLAIFTLSLWAICMVSEVVRGALLAVDPGQTEAGYAVGLTKVQTIRRIILPQMLPIAVPSLLNTVIGLLKGSSIMMVLGVMDVMTGALLPASDTYKYLEAYIAAGLIYWGITIVLEFAANRSERYFGRFRHVA